ncbi:MAG: DUF3015 domain-containing protein [Geminicoccaceae bacterium]
MKALVSMALAMGLASGMAYADNHAKGETADSSGCGVGTILWKGQSGAVPQILAVTTNGTLGNQTFGITSGTLGCTKDGVVSPPAEVRMLTVSHLDNLAKDMARGEGETLVSFATAMKVEEQDQPLLFATLKSNFTRIFPADNVSADAVLMSIQEVMAEDDTLARYVEA